MNDSTDDPDTDGFVLHLRPYTDSRILVDLFARDFGRFTAVARLTKQQGRSNFEPFKVLSLAWRGKYELKFLYQAEVQAARAYRLNGSLAFCGLYLNELLTRLIPTHQASEGVFDNYETCLASLSRIGELVDAEPFLRKFEFALISELGYGINWLNAKDDRRIEPAKRYRFNGEEFSVCTEPLAANVFSGEQILEIGRGVYEGALRAPAKAIARQVIDRLLEGRALKSRELFRS